MIIVLRPHVTEEELARVVDQVRELGLTPHVSRGLTRTIVGCIGDEDRLREFPMLAFPAIETILPVEKPYKLSAREFAAGLNARVARNRSSILTYRDRSRNLPMPAFPGFASFASSSGCRRPRSPRGWASRRATST